MEDISKNIRINQLFDLYGNLLTDNQQKMVELYYQMDLSLSEIAEQEGISRNAVYDALKKGAALLENYEEKLQLLKREEEMNKFFKEIKKNRTKEEIDLIESIERKVNS